jgi:DNA-binding NtrC family response regulator
MPSLWIVHRDPTQRAAISRLAGAAGDTVSGAPGDPLFDTAPAPDAVLLGIGDDLERELHFAHRLAPRLRGSAWILLAEPDDLDAVRRLFDTLDAELLAFPPEARTLRQSIRGAARRHEAEPPTLSQRRAREALSERFSRRFADLELAPLLRALDPRMLDVPLLIRGEPGTGRATLARYVAGFGGTAGGALIHVPCTPESSPEDLLQRITAESRTPRARRVCALWLENVDRLRSDVQQLLLGWIESVLPEGTLHSASVRWIATAGAPGRGDAGLDPGLQRALGAISIQIPPLRERRQLVASLASSTALGWGVARGERPRRLGEDAVAVLEEYPWPGNVAELEAVVTQSLAASAADPLGAAQLVLDGEPFAPLEPEPEPLPEEPRFESIPDEHLRKPAERSGGGTQRGEAERSPHDWPAERSGDGAQQSEAERSPDTWPAQHPTDEPGPEGPLRELAAQIEVDAQRGEAERGPARPADATLRRLVRAVAHEVRNPLTAVRTFAELLPERYADRDFRERFSLLARNELRRIEEVVGRLERLASLPAPRPRPVDVTGMLEEILEARREAIHARRLLVLKELDPNRPEALCDPDQLRVALEALIDESLQRVPERGDLYLASKHHDAGLRGQPSVRVLLRHRGPAGPGPTAPVEEASTEANALAFAVAEALVRAQGGVLTFDGSDGHETVIVLDLPAPS